VTIGPWDPMAAGATGRGRLRASDADREQAIDVLKAAFVQGRLTKDELDARAGQALASRTCAELAAITADIRPALTAAQPPSKSARAHARKRVNKKVTAWGACAIALLPVLGAAFFTFYGGYFVLLLFAFVGLMVSAGPSASRRPGPLPLRGPR
jgi:type VI protein secretion system component VasF